MLAQNNKKINKNKIDLKSFSYLYNTSDLTSTYWVRSKHNCSTNKKAKFLVHVFFYREIKFTYSTLFLYKNMWLEIVKWKQYKKHVTVGLITMYFLLRQSVDVLDMRVIVKTLQKTIAAGSTVTTVYGALLAIDTVPVTKPAIVVFAGWDRLAVDLTMRSEVRKHTPGQKKRKYYYLQKQVWNENYSVCWCVLCSGWLNVRDDLDELILSGTNWLWNC